MTNEQIKYGLENEKLKLSVRENITHYEIVGFCYFLPLIIGIFFLRDYLRGMPQPLTNALFWFMAIPAILGVFFYFLQKHRLKFKIVHTNLNKSELDKIIDKVAVQLDWEIIYSNSKAVVANTHPGLLSGSWGEQITILFDHKKVLVNSICNPKKRSSLVSMGRNIKNEKTLISEINKASSY